jgi:SET domain-containing protein
MGCVWTEFNSRHPDTMQDVVVKKSKINNQGVFAARNFKQGEVVLKWNPQEFKETEVEQLSSTQKNFLYKSSGKSFLMQAPEKYINHSCESNTKAENNSDIAIRDIKKGEEITSDYASEVYIPFKCKCGGKNCRGIIGAQN